MTRAHWWDQVRNFTPEEVGDRTGHSMDGRLMLELQRMRDFSEAIYPGTRFIVHAGFATGGHSENSQHYLGRAVDFHAEAATSGKRLHPLELFVMAMRFNFSGVGLYEWGVHVDMKRGVRLRRVWVTGEIRPPEYLELYKAANW